MMKTNFNLGNKVKIVIYDPGHWTMRAVVNLNGKTGKIVKVEEYGHLTRILVEFDIPAKRFYSNGREHKSFWFDPQDLIKL